MKTALRSLLSAPRPMLHPYRDTVLESSVLDTVPGESELPESGMPQDRHARIAARRSFVDMKQRFISAVGDLSGVRGDWLRRQVRQAQEPMDLWLLRGAVFAALDHRDAAVRRTRIDLHRALDSVFPDAGELTLYNLPR